MTDIFKNIITEEISDADRIMNADGTINFHSFSTKETLNPDIFNEDGYLKEGFISSLLDIYHKIIKGINFLRESDISDVVLVGSLVSFHYSSYSDIDMHILVDMSKVDKDIEELREELDDIRVQWNKDNDIEVDGYEVEIFFQDISDKNITNGMYSLLEDDWIKFPDPETKVLDKDAIERKSIDYIETIDELEGKKRLAKKKILKLWDKITNGRREALKKEGEFSNENIIFKILRRTEHLQKLKALVDKVRETENKQNENMQTINLKEFTNNISESAKEFCKKNGIKSIKRSELLKLIESEIPERTFTKEGCNENDENNQAAMCTLAECDKKLIETELGCEGGACNPVDEEEVLECGDCIKKYGLEGIFECGVTEGEVNEEEKADAEKLTALKPLLNASLKKIEMDKGERVAEESANLVLVQRTKKALLSAVLAIILSAGFVSPVAAQKNGLDVNNPEIKEKVERINKEWSTSLTQEDKLNIIHFYADDQDKLKTMSREDKLALREAVIKKMREVIDTVNAAPLGKIRLVGFPNRNMKSKLEAEMDAYHHFVNLTNGRIFTGMKGKTVKVFRRADNETLFVVVEFDLK